MGAASFEGSVAAKPKVDPRTEQREAEAAAKAARLQASPATLVAAAHRLSGL